MIIDISREISEDMAVYKNDEKFRPNLSKVKSLKENGSNMTKMVLYSHTGTHIDAPFHFFESGKRIDELPLDKFYGKCKVFDLTNLDEKITSGDLEQLDIQDGDIILFKTKNSFSENFNFNFVYLDKSAAEYLVSKKVKMVGIDELGVEREQPGHETHKLLLGAEIPIIEGLNLRDVPPGSYTIYCFPLKIRADASPARAVLIK